VYEIDGESKIAKFSHPLYFAFPTKWFSPWNWVAGAAWGSNSRMMGLPRAEKKFDDIFSHLDTISTNVTDRRTPGNSKDRAYA